MLFIILKTRMYGIKGTLLALFCSILSVYSFCREASLHIQKDKTPLAAYLKPCVVTEPSSGLEGIDCIYVINLDKRPDKWERVSGIFREQGLKINRMSAINGWELAGETLRELSGPYPVRLKGGEYGCLLSHLSVLKDAHQRGFQRIWVCEDDIEILESIQHIPLLIRQLEKYDADWDVFYTDCRPRLIWKGQLIHTIPPHYTPRPDERCDHPADYLKTEEVFPDVIKIGYRTGTTSMIISRKGMEKLINYFTHIYVWSQIDLDMHFVPGIREYSSKKDLVSNLLESTSDVLNEVDESHLPQESKEAFWNRYQLTLCQYNLEKSEISLRSYLKLYQQFPDRAEPLYHLALFYRQSQNFLLGFLFSKLGKEIPLPKDSEKSEPWIYQWGLKLEYALCAYHLGKSEEFRKTAQQLLAIESLPKETRAHILELFSANFSSHSGPCPKQGSS